MDIEIIDTHAHLDFPEFKPDFDKVMERASSAGVTHILTVGINLAASRESVSIAQLNPQIFAAVGCHPHEASGFSPDYLKEMESLALRPKVVAIGEIGLDYFRNNSPRDDQLYAFREQLGLARRLNLPVIIHARQAESDAVSVLREWMGATKSPADGPPGVIHCFSGSAEAAERYLSMGFMLSIGAYLGYPSSRVFQQVIERLPMDRLLLETDSPFLPPQVCRGLLYFIYRAGTGQNKINGNGRGGGHHQP
jgi:TatD DNase family protein